jgi:hypothetical protein
MILSKRGACPRRCLPLIKRRVDMSHQRRILLWTLFVLSVAIGAQAEDRVGCSNATLRGSYGLHATGSVIGVGDFAAVGRFTFDGKGGLSAKLFLRINGNSVETPQLSGTYSVSSDCIVTDTWGGSTHVSVIVDGGKGYFIVNNTPGEGDTISGEARRQ